MNDARDRIANTATNAVYLAFGSATKDELLSLITYLVTGPLFGKKIQVDRMHEKLNEIRVDALLAEMEELSEKMPSVTGTEWRRLADRFTVVNDRLNELQRSEKKEEACNSTN